jgi:hypothetical protein
MPAAEQIIPAAIAACGFGSFVLLLSFLYAIATTNATTTLSYLSVRICYQIAAAARLTDDGPAQWVDAGAPLGQSGCCDFSVVFPVCLVLLHTFSPRVRLQPQPQPQPQPRRTA